MRVCTMSDCGKPHVARGFCIKHYRRFMHHGDASVRMRAENGDGREDKYGHIHIIINGKEKLKHVMIAESIYGGPLPDGAEVHHADGDARNNDPTNLFICENHAYHMLLHRLMRSFDACGHASWRKCVHCKKWDAPENLKITKESHVFHQTCANKKSVEFQAKRKALKNATK
jgi:hypothetical protein